MPHPDLIKFENDMKNRLTDKFQSLLLEERPISPKLKGYDLSYSLPISYFTFMMPQLAFFQKNKTEKQRGRKKLFFWDLNY